MRHSLLLVGALVAALAAGCAGEDGKDGADGLPGQNGANGADGQDGTNGQNGNNGTDAPWAGTLSITVQKDGVGVPNAVITGIGAGEKTTNVEGRWSGEVAIGAYVVGITAPNLTPITGLVVGVQAEATTAITVPMVSDGSIPGAAPTFNAPAPMANVGFDKTIELGISGLADADTSAANLTIEWKKTAGPAVTITNGNTATATIRLADVPTARTYDYHGTLETVDLPDTMGVVAMSPDTAGRYTFAVTVKDPEGHVLTKTVSVSSAAFNSTGTRMVARNQPVHLRGVAGKGTYAWSMVPANGSTAQLVGTGRFVTFTPDVAGKYTVTEGDTTLEIFANDFTGSQQANTATCKGCHDGVGTDRTSTIGLIIDSYSATDHAHILELALAEEVDYHYQARCMACHTVGYDPTASNGGFDDKAAGLWSPPSEFSETAFEDLVAAAPEAAARANIQCENCHGAQGMMPGNGHGGGIAARTTLSSAMCASCHASGAHHDRYYLWEESGHSNTQLAIDEGGTASCARCHSAEGFIAWSDAANATGTFPGSAPATGTTTITCAACHDPHDATNPAQLRLYGTLPKLPNGVEVRDAGSAALCMACHNTRQGTGGKVRNDANYGTTQDDRDPHAPSQQDVLYGTSAYFMDGVRPSAHLSIEDSCVTCHMKIAPAGMHVSNTNHTFEADETVCAGCHSEHVTGGALMAETEEMLVDVEGLLIAKGLKAIQTAGVGFMIEPVDHDDDCTGPTKQVVNVLPSAITHVTTTHGRMAFELEFPAPGVTLTFPATGTNGTCTKGATRTLTHVVVKTAQFWNPGGTTQIFPPGHTLNKAFWNFLLIEEDKSLGVHNPSFAIEVLDNTIEKLNTLP